MVPNIQKAKRQFTQIGFSPYSSAYITTNEDLRYALQYMPKDTDNALTVAASGDHPLFTALYGAKYVDTFDITFNAKLIMDIKTAALSLLNHKEYCQLLKDILNCKDIKSIKNSAQIIQKLNPLEQNYIVGMRGKSLFGKENFIDPLSLPREQEFRDLKNIIKEPFNFIWSDIKNLHKTLTKNYDFMHLSNIFDYQNISDSVRILYTLTRHINPNGVICFESIVYGPGKAHAIYNQFSNIAKDNIPQSWDFYRKAPMLYVMQRVR